MGFTGKKQIILVGDACTGKSALALRLTHELFADCYIPTRFDSHAAEIVSQHGHFELSLLDTSGKESSDVRRLAYNGCDTIIVCFDLTQKNSFDNLEALWLPEVTALCPNAAIFIAGCKRDAVVDDEPVVERRHLEELMVKVGAVAYIECSAKTGENVEELFELAVEPRNTKQKKSGVSKMFGSVKSTTKVLRRLYSTI